MGLICHIVGARPQFVKVAVVMRSLEQAGASQVLVHTGQHYDENMSDVFFEELGIPRPDFHLGVGAGNHGAQTGRMLEAIERTLLELRPEWVVVYGDTNSTLAGALAAAKLHAPVAHVEAGLRSFNRRMPEEINRVLTDHLSRHLYAPTRAAVENLLHEGVGADAVHLVGDVMYDAALYYGAKAEGESRVLERLGLRPKSYVLATAHRAENTDDSESLRALFEGLARVHKDCEVVLPLHPRTRAALQREAMLEKVSRTIFLVEPVGYLDMLMLEKNALVIATDSGGVQKEAFFYRVPCVTLRGETEWAELVELGWNRLAPPVSAEAVEGAVKLSLSAPPGAEAEPYGDGRACAKIARLLQASGLRLCAS